MQSTRTRGSLFRRPILLYDRACRLAHGLDRPGAEVGPALCLEVRRSHWEHALPDGAVIRRSDRVGILHLNNRRIAMVHLNGLPPQAVGIEVRRWFLASLHELARLATLSGHLDTVRAFSATTIFYASLTRLGFQMDSDGLFFPGVVGAYQRLLLVSLHPRSAVRFRSKPHRYAQRLWLTRETLLARYGRLIQDSASAQPTNGVGRW